MKNENKNRKPASKFTRVLASLLSLLLSLGPAATPVYALTDLADQPLGAQVKAKPNIMLTIDDSTSMLYDFLPDTVVNTYCRDGSGGMNASCGYNGFPVCVNFDVATNTCITGYSSPQYIWEQAGYPYQGYDNNFPKSGPGAGCNTTVYPFTCSGGVDPGALPGVSTYPSASGSPLAGKPYEYWLLWPAPAHNSELNRLYYNPRLTYLPPVAGDGTSYPSMTTTATTGWTRVPANPYRHLDNPWGYAADLRNPLIDLTATVTVGLWCNSDWTQGNDDSGVAFASNAEHCRSNGNISTSGSDSTPANIGDYNYPWAPPLLSPNDVTSKVDTSTINYTTMPYANATVKTAWTDRIADTAHPLGQFFYENDNVLWCDVTSADWPQTSVGSLPQTCDLGLNPIVQTCNGFLAAGTCSATSNGTCAGAVTGVCNTGNGTCSGYTAGVCNTGNGTCTGFTAGACNTGNGTCTGYAAGACNTTNGTCAGFTTGTCNTGNGNCNGTAGTCNTGNGNCNSTNGTCNTANGNCSGFTAGTCNTANGNCAGYVAGACGGGQAGSCGSPVSCSATREACVAGTAASCSAFSPQTCVGTKRTCDAQTQSCNGYGGPQTCANVVAIPPDASTCTSNWDPPGCNITPDPEHACVYKTTCPDPTYKGTCSIKGNTCTPATAATDCPTIMGTCSLQTGKSCSSAADCTGLNYCNGTTSVCSTQADCTIASGHCSIQTGKSCSIDGDCAAAGTCNYKNTSGVTNGVCNSNSDCTAFPNHCATTTGTTCTTVQANSASCPVVSGSGTCTYASYTGGSCTTVADCTKVCQNSSKLGSVCTADSQCTVTGTCTAGNTGSSCVAAADCNKAGACTTGSNTGVACTANGTNATCGPVNKCSAGQPNTTTCTVNNQCDVNGACTTGTNTGTACTANGTNATCGPINKCSAGLPNTTTCTTNAQCNTAGTCTTGTNTGSACSGNGANATCGPINKCSAGLPNTTTCTTNAQCNTTGTCTTGTNTGTACTGSGANATCGAINKCSAGKPNTTTCSSASDCNVNGTCTTGTNTGASCTANGTNSACGPINKCSAGKPNTTTCTSASDCVVNGTCSTGANTGASCTGTGAQSACGAVNKCTSGQPATTSCTTATQCNVNGTCTSGANTGATCTGTGAVAACGAVNKCSAGQPATTSCTTAAQCNVNGTCASGANTGATCTGTGAQAACGAVNKCTAGLVGNTCTASSQCTATGICQTGNVGAVCTTNGTTSECAVAAGTCSNNGAACTVANQATTCAQVTGTCSYKGNACTSAANCPTYGHCSIQTGTACLTNAECANVDVPINPNAARCDSTGVSGSATTTLLMDANGAGKACRRNNHAYTGVPASRFNYPSGKYTTPVMGELVAGQGCSATNHYANVPRHYWKTSIEWCSSAISTAGDKWVGYGDNSTGTCQSFKDDSHIYPRFYQFGSGTDAVSNYTTAAFARVDLKVGATYTHTFTDTETGETTTITRSYDQEMENYANWFAYYRTRIQAVKAATSLSFLGTNSDGTFNLDENKFRVGLETLSNDPVTSFVDIQGFDVTQKTKWATQLYGIDIPMNNQTPNLNAMVRVGDYYLNGRSDDLSGATDPIILSCQKNWHMLFTDGITNQTKLPTYKPGNVDDTLLAALPEDVMSLNVGDNWPAPFRESNVKTTDNSASDYAMQYWTKDLRTTGAQSTNNVSASASDPATWQHVNFAALSLGTDGKLATGNQTAIETQLSAGALQWTVPYPSTNQPDASGVDDLWHAAINARGRFVNAKSVAELQVGMGQILADALNTQGARSGVAFTSTNLSTAGNNYIYRATFQPSWGGTLVKVKIDANAAEVSEVWHAEKQLALMLTPTIAIPDPWKDSRKVVTMKTDGTTVPFLWDSIDAAQQDALAPGNADRGKKVLAWLRGDQSNEDNSVIGKFRKRDYTATAGYAGALGDIVNGSAVYVGIPNAPYLDIDDKGYSTFKSSKSTRVGRVYVGANDGMLHGFDDANGNEVFGYVPKALYRDPSDAGLGSLTYQFGGLPPFVHHFFVDSTPTATDLTFDAPDSEDWHTMLIGGLGKGGKAYYAIDVTDPADFTSETEIAKKIKWEFTNSDLGYTYGSPLVTKTRAWGGKWVVIVPSGYNNASGVGKIFFIDPKDGSLLKTMATTDGTPADPSGLAQIAGYTQKYSNYMTDQVYAGDLHGNLWRFDMLDTDPDNWKVGQLAKFSAGGKAQPVTIPPRMEVDITNGTDRWVFVGTGKLLADSDLSNTDQQSFYAMRDGTTKVPGPIPSTPLDANADLTPVSDAAGLATAAPVGWKIDLPKSGQRIVTPLQTALFAVAFSATSPNTDPLRLGSAGRRLRPRLCAWRLARRTTTGPAAPTTVRPTTARWRRADFIVLSGGDDSSGVYVPNMSVVITLGSSGKTIVKGIHPPSFLYAHRMSWRVLNE